MRQFETIFVAATDQPHTVKARIFTAEEEPPFAGHPVVGAAATLHERLKAADSRVDWQFVIHDRVVPAATRRDAEDFTATMDQGPASFPSSTADDSRTGAGCPAQPRLGQPAATAPPGGFDGPAAPYPDRGHHRRSSTGKGRSCGPREPPHRHRREVCLRPGHRPREGPTWDNAGTVEDVATGSAAGPAAAYLHAHALAGHADPVQIAEGQFVGRPSTITVARDVDGHLWVGGPVSILSPSEG